MLKADFLKELEKKLSGLPQADIDERLNFYSEMIDDRMEDGLSEEEAVAAIGTVDEVYEEIVSEIPLSKLVKKKFSKDRKMSSWEIALIILGSPIWFSLLIALVSVAFSAYVVLWSLIVSVWAVGVSLVATAVGLLVGTVFFMIRGFILSGFAVLGAALFLLGFSFVFLYLCKLSTKGVVFLTKKLTLLIKSMFIRKENE